MSNVAELLTEVRRSAEDRDRETAEQYKALVRLAAEGKAGDPDEVLAIVEDAGKTADDLAAAVGRIARRRGLRAAMDRAGDADRRAAECGRLAAQLDAECAAELERVRRRYAALAHEARGEAEACLAVARAGRDAERELRDTADPDLLAEVRLLETMSDRASAEAAGVRAPVSAAEADLREPVPAAPWVLGEVSPAVLQWQARRERAGRVLPGLRRQLEPLAERAGELAERLTAARLRLLDPDN